jgi:hypothetical protein
MCWGVTADEFYKSEAGKIMDNGRVRRADGGFFAVRLARGYKYELGNRGRPFVPNVNNTKPYDAGIGRRRRIAGLFGGQIFYGQIYADG